MALFARVDASLQREAGGVDDSVVVCAVRLYGCASFPCMQRTWPMTALASDAGAQLGKLALEIRDWRWIARVTGDASIRQYAVEAAVVVLVTGAEVPASLAIPGERKLEDRKSVV